MPGRHCTRPRARSPRPRALAQPLALALTLAAILGLPAAARAATHTVITPLDTGPGSLRAAVASAGDGDLIAISPFLAGVTIELQDEIEITADVTITGEAAPGVTVDANLTGRIFEIEPGAEVVISHLALTGGRAPGGGAISNKSRLTLISCTLSGNEATDDHSGGAVTSEAVDQPTRLVIDGCQITGNTAGGWGGGVMNATYGPVIAELEIRNSSVTFNSAAHGGGVVSLALSGGVCLADVTDSVISWNTAGGWGGGLRAGSTSAAPASLSLVTLTGTDIQGNHAGGRGGGVATAYGSGHITLAGCTVAGNTADDGGPDLAQYTAAATVAFLGGNTIGSTAGLLDPASMPSDQLDVGALAPAVPAAAQATARPAAPDVTDLAGATRLPRPAADAPDAPGDLGAPADPGDPAVLIAAGAARPAPAGSSPATRATLTVVNPADSGFGTLRDAVAAAAAGDLIVFHPDLTGAVVALESPLAIVRDVEISGEQAPGVVLDGGDATRLLEVGASVLVRDLTLRRGRADRGGAILNRGRVTLQSCDLFDNRATDGSGGAIFSDNLTADQPVRVVLSGCQLVGNSATQDGGAIASGASDQGVSTLEIQATTLALNSGLRGGAIYQYAIEDAVALTVIDGAEIYGNTSAFGGAGLRLHRTDGSRRIWARVVDTSFTDNTSGNSGGGIAVLTGGVHLELRGCTLLENAAGNQGPDLAQADGAVPFIFGGGNVVGTTAGVHTYAATASDVLGSATSVADPADPGDPATPAAPATVDVFPNPFNPRATVRFTLPVGGPAALEVVDLRGRVVARPWRGEVRAQERVAVPWDGTAADGRALGSGVYLFRVVGADGQGVVVRGTLVR